jgi:hypothetical protein
MRLGVERGQETLIDKATRGWAARVQLGASQADFVEDWAELKQLRWLFSTEWRHQGSRPPANATIEARLAGPWPELPLVHALETPKPVVTYLSRLDQYSRAILNERQVLRYILSKYDVILRVSNLQEPLHEAIESMRTTDVLLGMHGESWAVAAPFIKRGSVLLELFPYGWRLPNGDLIRGREIKQVVASRQATYLEWVNPYASAAFFRRQDFPGSERDDFKLHPDEGWPLPTGPRPHPSWLYQNTYMDLVHAGPIIDEAMRVAGIPVVVSAAKAMA